MCRVRRDQHVVSEGGGMKWRQMDKNLCYSGNLARLLGSGEGASKQHRTCLLLIKEWSGSARGSREATAST